MGLLSASLTALYVRDSSYLPSLPDLPTIPHLPDPRELVAGSTVLFGLACLVAVLILAYVTNPSESSFRTFLTEEAFRRHLRKLNAPDEEEGGLDYLENPPTLTRVRDGKGKVYKLPQNRFFSQLPSTSSSGCTHQAKAPRVHFTNRLAIALHTPAHVFRSYGLCTIAVTQQVDISSPFTCLSGNRANAHHHTYVHPQHGHVGNHSNQYSQVENGTSPDAKIRGTWFIGAFGKWWIGGDLEFMKDDLLLNAVAGSSATLGEEAGQTNGELKSGHYDIRVLDDANAFEGLPTKSRPLAITSVGPAPNSAPIATHGAATTRSRASTRSVKQTATPLPSRSATPPPSITRGNGNSNGHRSNGAPPSPKNDRSLATRKSRSNSNANVIKSASVLDDVTQSPDVTNIMQEISKSQAAVQEMRDHLVAFQSQAFASQAALKLTLEEYRSRKKQEDAARLDLKSRTKTLEESKRQADTGRRDAEKRLKAAQTARDTTSNRMLRLASEIESMKKRMGAGEEKVKKSKQDLERSEMEHIEEVEKRRGEAKALEESVGTLGAKAKELEEALATEKERLAELKEEVDRRKQVHHQQQQAALALVLQMQQQRNGPLGNGFVSMEDVGIGAVEQPPQPNWTGFPTVQTHTHNFSSSHAQALPTSFNPFEPPNQYVNNHRRPSAELFPATEDTTGVATSARMRSLSLGELMSSHQSMPTAPTEMQPSLSPGDAGFSPFDADDRDQIMPLQDGRSFSSLNVATSLLPANLVNSIETESTSSIHTPSTALPDSRGESRWRSNMWPFKSDHLSKSTPASSASGVKRREFDPFDAQRAVPFKPSTTLDQTSSLPEEPKSQTLLARKWFSKSTTTSMTGSMAEGTEPISQVISAPEGTTAASKSRLNPDAKVFNLPKGRNLLSSALWTPVGISMPPVTNIRPAPLHMLPTSDLSSSISSTTSLPILTPAAAAATGATPAPASKLRFRGLFSSPFAPSPAEREALQRALEKNLSHDRISVASDGSGDGTGLRLPPSPFGLPQPGASLFDLDEEDADASWGKVLKAAKARKGSIGESIARQTTR